MLPSLTHGQKPSLRFALVPPSTWSRTIELIRPPGSMPSIQWPPERIRRIVTRDFDDDDDDEDLKTPLAALSRRSTDDDVLAAIARADCITTVELATALRVSKQAAWSRLRRLKHAGHIRQHRGTWSTSQTAEIDHGIGDRRRVEGPVHVGDLIVLPSGASVTVTAPPDAEIPWNATLAPATRGM